MISVFGEGAARRGVLIGIAAMAVIVTASNILVQYPINDWLTWGALTYPVAFLVTDLINRAHGPAAARRVIYVGFALAVALSIALATPVSWLLVDSWLADYAHRTSIDLWVFAAAALGAMIVAIATIGYQSVKVTGKNPAEVLKAE